MLLIDTDMLVLLVASGKLTQVAANLGYEADQVRRLPAAIYQVRKSRTFRNNYGEAVLQEIAPIIEGIPEVDPLEDVDLLDTLSEVVDEGEALLMAIAATSESTLLVSGDKRAVADLAGSEDAEFCVQELQGRIVTLEAVLWMLVSQQGGEATRADFGPVMGHKTLRIVLSAHAAANNERCLDGIRSYFNDTARLAQGLLFNPSPDVLGLDDD